MAVTLLANMADGVLFDPGCEAVYVICCLAVFLL